MSEALMRTPWRKLRASPLERFIWFNLVSSASGSENGSPAPRFPWWRIGEVQALRPGKRTANALCAFTAEICVSFYRPPDHARHWHPTCSHFPRKFSYAFSIGSRSKRWGIPRTVSQYEQGGKAPRGPPHRGSRPPARNPRLLDKGSAAVGEAVSKSALISRS
jgi:hypothetical protein